MLDFFQRELNMKSSDPIADIGSGTGILSELFLRNGNEVFGVEPNEAMRMAAERNLRSIANFHSLIGTAERTTLPANSVRFVTAGQAFHWFDPPRARAEFERILVADGWVMLIWNERKQESEDAFSTAYDAAVKEFQTPLAQRRARQAHIPGFGKDAGVFRTRRMPRQDISEFAKPRFEGTSGSCVFVVAPAASRTGRCC